MNDAAPATYDDPVPTPEIPDPPQLKKMVSAVKEQIRTLRWLLLKHESERAPDKARRFQLLIQRMESAQHVLEALEHWLGPDLDDKKVWHVLAYLLKSPPPSIGLIEALKHLPSEAPR